MKIISLDLCLLYFTWHGNIQGPKSDFLIFCVRTKDQEAEKKRCALMGLYMWVDPLCLATCRPVSSPGCCYFQFVWLLIGWNPEWTTHTPADTQKRHRHQEKHPVLTLEPEIFLPFLKKHSVFRTLYLLRSCNQNKMASEVWVYRHSPSERKREKQQIKPKVLHAELRQIKMFAFHLWNYLTRQLGNPPQPSSKELLKLRQLEIKQLFQHV